MATGDSYRSLSFHWRIGRATISDIVKNVCEAIWNRLKDTYIQIPNTKEKWEKVAQEFAEKWQFPNCIGALDGKHIILNSPDNSGSLFYNYKGSFSIILLGLSDANNRFLYIDVGAYGRNSDGGVYSN